MKRLAPTLALALTLATMACRDGPASVSGCPSAEPARPPVDPLLMAFLSAARASHHEADVRQSQGDTVGAVAALDRLVAMTAPRAAEVDEVLADAYARLAELRLEQHDLDRADHDVQTGLGRASGPTYFRGHLLEVQGLVEEARAGTLIDAGRAGEAALAKTRAIGLLEEAVRVQQQVIERALRDGGKDD